jgi:hypothetical protein
MSGEVVTIFTCSGHEIVFSNLRSNEMLKKTTNWMEKVIDEQCQTGFKAE